MAKKNVKVDPAVPFKAISIGGRDLKMAFDYDSLALAEAELVRRGFQVNLLLGMLQRNFTSVRALFAASLLHYHPEIDFHEAQRMVRPDTLVEILTAMDEAWELSMPESKPEDPRQPGSEAGETTSGPSSSPTLA